jgi:serine protease SohB
MGARPLSDSSWSVHAWQLVATVAMVTACAAWVEPVHSFDCTLNRSYRTKKHSLRPHSLILSPPIAVNSRLMATPSLAESVSSSPLTTYFLETVISNGVPALFTILVIAFAASAFRRGRRVEEADMDEFGLTPPVGLSRRSKQRQTPSRDERDGQKSANIVSALYNDLYGDQNQNAFTTSRLTIRQLFGSGLATTTLPKNVGVPALQYLTITHLNRKYDSYQYSMNSVTQSRALAAANYRQQSFENAIRKAFSSAIPSDPEGVVTTDIASIISSPSLWSQLQAAEAALLRLGAPLLHQVTQLQAQLTKTVTDFEIQQHYEGEDDGLYDDLDLLLSSSGRAQLKRKATSQAQLDLTKNTLLNEISAIQRQVQELELTFVRDVVAAIMSSTAMYGKESPSYHNVLAMRNALLGDISASAGYNGSSIGNLLTRIQDRPLTMILTGTASANGDVDSALSIRRPRLFVTRFDGDVQASQVSNLREVVTAITGQARAGVDEVLVILKTGGGTVTGYGLAAAQLLRLKDAGLKLTIAVEQVAASGGYMMCCVADHIVASPFAVLGSIGVISDIPNVYDRLKREGIEFQTVTAGKYKRTLTPTKKVTKDDLSKTKADIEEILTLFRDFVALNRPQLDIDRVATGETWFGTDALKLGLCDEIRTADDVIADYVRGTKQGKLHDVYEVTYTPPPSPVFGSRSPSAALHDGISSDSLGWDTIEGRNGFDALIRRGVSWVVRTIVNEVRDEFGTGLVPLTKTPSVAEQYLAQDDADVRYRA